MTRSYSASYVTKIRSVLFIPFYQDNILGICTKKNHLDYSENTDRINLLKQYPQHVLEDICYYLALFIGVNPILTQS